MNIAIHYSAAMGVGASNRWLKAISAYGASQLEYSNNNEVQRRCSQLEIAKIYSFWMNKMKKMPIPCSFCSEWA